MGVFDQHYDHPACDPLPILTGILVPWCVGMSIRAGMEALVLPVSRGAVYFAKFSVVAIAGRRPVTVHGSRAGAGLIHKVDAPIPWEIARCLLGGWVACLPLPRSLESQRPGAVLPLRWH